MFCTKCGNEMEEQDRFCRNCGAPREVIEPVVEETPEQMPAPESEPVAIPDTPAEEQTPVQSEPAVQEIPFQPEQAVPVSEPRYTAEQLNRPQKNNSAVKIFLAAVAAVLVVAVVAVAVLAGGLFESDAAKVFKALVKTGEAYAQVGGELDLPDLTKLIGSQEYKMNMSMWIEELDDAPEAEGFGVRFDASASVPDRKMDMILTPFYGSVDMLDVMMKIDDSELYIGAEELTDDTFYMIDTQTLGDDLAEMGAGDEYAGVGFNFFDLMEYSTQNTENMMEALEAFGEVYEDFKDEVSVSKTGSETVEVNGNDVKCTAYDVVITEQAVLLMIDGFEEYLTSVSSPESMIEMYEAMGMPEEVIDELEVSFEEADFSDAFGDLRESVDGMEDVVLKVCISDGYVMAVVWEGEVEGGDVAVTLNLGGGKNYVDDLSLIMEADGSEMVMTCSGNHTGKGGLLDSVAELSIDGDVLASSDFSYDADSGELFWDFEVEEVEICVDGTLTVEKDGFNLRVDELGVYEYGESMGIALGFEYGIGEYEGDTVEVEESVALMEMTEEELSSVGEKLTLNAYLWLTDLSAEIPALQGLLG